MPLQSQGKKSLKPESRIRNPKNFYHGWINLNKPLGISSADAVFQVKRLIHPSKIGHAGTLDPLASGVLPLALGEGTKCVNLLMDARKTYEFTVTFGERRNTDDAEGEVIATSGHIPDKSQILAILPQFTGPIMQVPSTFSAIKVNGQRAYAMARAGEEVVLAARPVTIYSLDLLSYNSPLEGESLEPSERGDLKSNAKPESFLRDFGGGTLLHDTPHQISPRGNLAPPQGGSCYVARFRAIVSKGTYIRSLGRDMAQALGTEGYISRLHRSAVGPFTDATAISLDFLSDCVHKPATPEGSLPWLTPLTTALDDIPAMAVDSGQLTRLRHGQQVSLAPLPDVPQIAVLHHGQLVGIARTQGNQLISTRLLNI